MHDRPARLVAARLELRPIEQGDLDELAAIIAMAGVREWWGTIGESERLQEDLYNGGSAFVIEVDGRCAGWLGVSEELEPDYRHAALDIMLAPDFQDRGIGSEALRTALHWLFGERGHHRVTIDPALANKRAIRAYEAVGFKPVGVMRDYERGPDGTWHDNLLMDMLAGDLR